MRKLLTSKTVAQIASLAPLALAVLTILALVLSVSADFVGPDI